MKNNRITVLMAMILAMVLLLSACGGGGNTQADEKQDIGNEEVGSEQDAEAPTATTKNTLTVSSYSDPKNLNPYASDGRNSSRICLNVFERLVDHNAVGDEYFGMLAESWEENDEGITFNLRKGVKFHEGQEMTAEDVVFSLQTAAGYSTANGGWDWIDWDNITAVDEYTVHIPYFYPCSLTIAKFAANNIYVMCKETWDTYGEEVSNHPNGTGPFTVGDWMQDDHCTLNRFEDYWGDKPVLETINFRFISENSQALIELETGGVDLVMDVPSLEVENIKASDRMELINKTPTVVDFLHMNNENEYLKDVRIRQAICYAMSQDDILTGVYRNVGEMSFSSLPPGIVGYTDEFEGDNYPYGTATNVEKAKELLAEAGYPDGFDIVIDVDDNADRIATAEILQNNMAQIGIKATINSQDFATLWEKIYAGEAAMFMLGVNAGSYEPDMILYLRWHSSNIDPSSGSNYTRFSNEEFDKCLDDARNSFDLEERNELYKRAQQIIMEECPSMGYYVRTHMYAAAPNLKGLQAYGEGSILYKCYFE